MRLRLRAAAAVVATVALVAVAVLAAVRGCDRGRRPPPPPASAAVEPRPASRSLVGAGSCTSSGCHAAPLEGHAPWQTAYTVWATRDPHARAHAVLREPLAERIVAAVAARDPSRPQPPAHKNMACVGCHATARGPRAGEGVSCESCHGPAGAWLVAHTAKGWKTGGNTLGMVDLADPYACASTCAGCHVGGPPTADGAIREVTHDLIAAGHPRLSFELRSYKKGEPPHWRDRFASPEGPESPGPVDEWSLGRLGALAAFLDQVATQSQAARSGDRGIACGMWPEFTAFDCHGCHRPAELVSSPTVPVRRGGIPPGAPRLEPMYWTHLDVVLPPEAAETLARVRRAIDTAWSRVPDAGPLAEAIRTVESARLDIHDRLAASDAGELADRIVAGTNAENWAEAVSALGGLEAVVDREAAAGRLTAEGALPRRLAALRRLLEFPIERVDSRTERFSSPRGYDAVAVAEHLRAIAKAVRRTAPIAPGAR
jgi:hypothetical protein